MNTVILYLEKAEITYQETLFMFENGFYQGAVSRAYYAGFYAVQATLENIQVSAKTHQGALTMFSKHFVKTKKLPIQTIKSFLISFS